MKNIYLQLFALLFLVFANLKSGNTQNLFRFLELHVGGQAGNLLISEKESFYAKTDSVYSGYLSLHTQLVSVFPLKKNPAIQVRIGAGIRSEIIYVFPLLPVHMTGISNRENLMVFEVNSWNNQLTLPMSVAADIYINEKGGLKFSVGIDHRFSIHQAKPVVYVVEGFDHELQGGFEYFDEALNESLSDHYTDEFRRYSLTGNIGIGIVDYGKIRATIGFKTNHFLVSPFKEKDTIKKHGGFEFFLEIPFW